MKNYKISFIASVQDNVPEETLKRLEHHAEELLDLDSWPEIAVVSDFKVEKENDLPDGILSAVENGYSKDHPVPVGVYPISNTGSLLVYKIDENEEKALVGLNTKDPEWCEIKEQEKTEDSDEPVTGFFWGKFFVPFSEVVRYS